jgi:chaperonin GroEL
VAVSPCCAPRRRLEDLKLTGDERIGADIVRRALEAPMRQIAINAGVDGSIVIQTCAPTRATRSATTPRPTSYEDMIKAGIVDPAKVTCAALQNAASVATLLLTTEALVSDAPDSKEKEAAGRRARAPSLM